MGELVSECPNAALPFGPTISNPNLANPDPNVRQIRNAS